MYRAGENGLPYEAQPFVYVAFVQPVVVVDFCCNTLTHALPE